MSRTPFIAANWKMYKTVHETVAFIKELRSLAEGRARRRDRRRAAVHGAAPGGRGGARARRSASPGRTCTGSAKGAFTGEVSAGDAEGGGRRVRDHRALRAAAAVRRDRRDREPQARGRGRARSSRRSSASARRSRSATANETLDGARSPDQAGARRPHGGSDRRAGRSPTSRCGRSARAATPRPAQAGEAHAHIRSRIRQWFGGNAAEQCHVIYGGSVKPDNIRELAVAARRGRRAGRRRQPRAAQLLRDRAPAARPRRFDPDVYAPQKRFSHRV